MITEDQEREKYEKIWQVAGYRQNSPGENLVPLFLEKCPWQPCDRVIDLGCGTGRAGKALAAQGLKVTLLDITTNALDRDATIIDLPFLNGNVWDLPFYGRPWDWIFSSDVLEHIPPEHVDKALDCMARTTGKGGFLQIACHPDGFGDVIGEKLHLTVQPFDWWEKKLRQRWEVKEIIAQPGPRMVAILGKANA